MINYLSHNSDITGIPIELSIESLIDAIHYWKARSREDFTIGVFPEQLPALESMFDWRFAKEVNVHFYGDNIGLFMGIPLVLVDDEEDL